MVACSGSEKLKMNVDQSTAGVSDYFELLKPRVMSLAIFTAIIGLLVTPNHVHPLLAVFSIIAIGAGAGAAGAINMWYDRDIDSIMCNMLELQPNDLPWINPNKHEEKWEKLMNNLRLVVGKIEYESNKKIRTVH